MEQEKNKNGTNLLLIFIIVILAVLCVLFATGTISFKTADKCVNENTNTQTSNNTNDLNNTIDNDLLGTYYLSNDNDKDEYYFTLKSDGKVDIISPSCSTGPLPMKTVSYRIFEKENAVILEIDINNDGTYQEKYIGTKVLNRFYQTTLSCIGTEDSYYGKK